MQEKSTTELLRLFHQLPDEKQETFLEENHRMMTSGEWFSWYLHHSGISVREIARRLQGHVTRSYLYALINGEKQNPSRDIVLLLCLAAHMNRRQTRRTLEIFALRDLYVKDPRDVLIMIALNRGQYDIDALNDRLEEYGLPLLGA